MKYKIGMYDNGEHKDYMHLTLNLDFLIIKIHSRCTLFIYKIVTYNLSESEIPTCSIIVEKTRVPHG